MWELRCELENRIQKEIEGRSQRSPLQKTMKTSKQLTAMVIAGVIGISALAPSAASAKTFSDVSSDHWAYTVIDNVSNAGLMIGQGSGKFVPDQALTQAEFLAVLYNIAGQYDKNDEGKNENTESIWYTQALHWAEDIGLIERDAKTPDSTITREEMGRILYEFLNHYFKGDFVYDDHDPGFADAAAFSTKANRDKVAILVNNGFLSGKANSHFDPRGTLTRAEAAAIADRITRFIETKPEQSTYFKERTKALLTEGTVGLSGDDQAFVALLNEQRAKEGVHILEVSPLLTKAAQLRAQEIVEKSAGMTEEKFNSTPSTFFHTRPNGMQGTTAIQDFLTDHSSIFYSRMHSTENLVRSQKNRMTPECAFTALMGSEGHRENMLSNMHEYVGVGYYSNGKVSAWVQLFASAN